MDLYKFLEEKLEMAQGKPMEELQGMIPGITDDVLRPEVLSLFKDELLKLHCFRNTKKLNIVPQPCFLATSIDEEPLLGDKLKEYIGEETKAVQVLTYKLSLEDKDFCFAENVDLYTFSFSPKIYDQNDPVLKTPGVWCLPVFYDPNDFTPKKEIRVIWSPEKMQDACVYAGETETREDIIEKLVSRFREVLEKGESNIPFNRAILVRCSPRSFVRKEIENEK